jgi:glutaredoxin 3
VKAGTKDSSSIVMVSCLGKTKGASLRYMLICYTGEYITRIENNMDNQKTVTIYSTPTCHFCHKAKDFFAEHNVAYTDHNVGDDMEKRQEMIEMTGQMGVPVIKIGDDVVVGFDEGKISALLELSQ